MRRRDCSSTRSRSASWSRASGRKIVHPCANIVHVCPICETSSIYAQIRPFMRKTDCLMYKRTMFLARRWAARAAVAARLFGADLSRRRQHREDTSSIYAQISSMCVHYEKHCLFMYKHLPFMRNTVHLEASTIYLHTFSIFEKHRPFMRRRAARAAVAAGLL